MWRKFSFVTSIISLLFMLAMPAISQAEVASTTTSLPQLDSAIVTCLKTNLGETAFAEISQGKRQPTDAEKQLSAACFAKGGSQFLPPGHGTNPPTFSPTAEACLKTALGDNFKDQLAQATPEQAKALAPKIKACFSNQSPGSNKPTSGNSSAEAANLPASVKTCLIQAVGADAAQKMFQGVIPDTGSDLAQKVQKANCFKDLHVSDGFGAGKPSTLPDEQRQCFEKAFGTSLDKLGSIDEATKKKAFQTCLPQTGSTDRPQLPTEILQCLKDKLGEQIDLIKGPEFMTEDQRAKVQDCFKTFSFNPGSSGNHSSEGDQPQLSPDAKRCLEKTLGKSIDQLSKDQMTDEQRQQVAKNCFGGSGPGGQTSGSSGNASLVLPADKLACIQQVLGREPKNDFTADEKALVAQKCFGQASPSSGGPTGSSDQNGTREECIKKIVGDNPTAEISADARAQIAKECFGTSATDGQSSFNSKETSTSPSGTPTSRPSLSADQQACVDRISDGKSMNQLSSDQMNQIKHECFNASDASPSSVNSSPSFSPKESSSSEPYANQSPSYPPSYQPYPGSYPPNEKPPQA